MARNWFRRYGSGLPRASHPRFHSCGKQALERMTATGSKNSKGGIIMAKGFKALAGVATVIGGLALAAGWASSAKAEVPESTDPIKIALFDWTSVNINAKILGTILTRLG